MDSVRFNIDHHQLGLVLKVMDLFLGEQPYGEVPCLLHSIVEQLSVRLRRRHADRRLEYKLILPVYQAIAFRRMVSAGMEVLPEPRLVDLQMLMSELDPKMSRYLHVA